MNNNRGGERTIYDESLFRIFLWSGFPIFMILLFACVAISGIVLSFQKIPILCCCFHALNKLTNGLP